MSRTYKVIDLRSTIIDPEPMMVTASTPEEAVRLQLDLELVRAGERGDLLARVYWTERSGVTNMVRLYRRVRGTA
ncbi:MAG: hypothetical protein P0Y65_05920 [Candidatus Devosia phytovorans]|uniref:Uncharacterized protein n=1 Tax=Candidatus Devosia phytovorans TaxID=3121372 RepID=A0AAJ5VYI9_9HYPH|nr:hypothetical protein [Devosia sp.]WEK05792.1 MAG: hypothetical protein P0Y65_05920 [Devosia sp.]